MPRLAFSISGDGIAPPRRGHPGNLFTTPNKGIQSGQTVVLATLHHQGWGHSSPVALCCCFSSYSGQGRGRTNFPRAPGHHTPASSLQKAQLWISVSAHFDGCELYSCSLLSDRDASPASILLAIRSIEWFL